MCRIHLQVEKNLNLKSTRTCISSNWYVNTSLFFFFFFFFFFSSKFAKKELEVKYQSLQLRMTSSFKISFNKREKRFSYDYACENSQLAKKKGCDLKVIKLTTVVIRILVYPKQIESVILPHINVRNQTLKYIINPLVDFTYTYVTRIV